MRNPMHIPREDIEALRREKYAGRLDANMHDDIARLMRGEPLAYVIGTQPFLGLEILLDSHPLIPRPETEWWTEELLKQLPQRYRTTISILDMCAGSGAIGLALLKHLPQAHVTFSDIDAGHIADIQKNIVHNHLDATRAELCTGNLFENLEQKRFDIIATNPPYIPEARTLQASVTEYEPPRALYGGTDGLTYITQILEQAPQFLKKDGVLYLECDSTHSFEVLARARTHGAKEAEIRNDPYGRPRLLVAYY